jgi:FeS assembly protein IscX
MRWTEAEEIGMALVEAHPTVDPLTVRFTQLREWVLQLPSFSDDPSSSNEARLEAIQMAWHEEWKDQQAEGQP